MYVFSCTSNIIRVAAAALLLDRKPARRLIPEIRCAACIRPPGDLFRADAPRLLNSGARARSQRGNGSKLQIRPTAAIRAPPVLPRSPISLFKGVPTSVEKISPGEFRERLQKIVTRDSFVIHTAGRVQSARPARARRAADIKTSESLIDTGKFILAVGRRSHADRRES
ncbi:hypothetical protein EVAR_76027_1 [Eumeta japonica]|uniref:Uncharacterized protein n=1 Tax=Eumeta variegata TaxID=151549 RepID=A0A4C1UAA2_EUMVA|nr:hypothetical protein EVAR_76027_1 [Eumeta japonica]